MHEALFDDGFLKDTGVSTLDFAKAMIDEGYHPMTMYFPLVVHGAMLVEQTESQAKEDLDLFIDSLRALAERAKSGTAAEEFKAAPRYAPRRRLDETQAARKPVLRWRPSNTFKQAAEWKEGPRRAPLVSKRKLTSAAGRRWPTCPARRPPPGSRPWSGRSGPAGSAAAGPAPPEAPARVAGRSRRWSHRPLSHPA